MLLKTLFKTVTIQWIVMVAAREALRASQPQGRYYVCLFFSCHAKDDTLLQNLRKVGDQKA